MKNKNNSINPIDVVIVGAGFAGLRMLYALRQKGVTATILEAGSGLGGTWFWNRYPGSRCDVESWEYSYGFSPELEQEWTWGKRYAEQPEILAYLQHMAKKFNLLKDIRFNHKVLSLTFDSADYRWGITTDNGRQFCCKFCILATGNLSVPNYPFIKEKNSFKGEVYHTGKWPDKPVEFESKSVAILGTGASAVQAVPIIAKRAKKLLILQRTPNWSIPANNRELEANEIQNLKRNYRKKRSQQRKLPLAFGLPPRHQKTFEADSKIRQDIFEKYWRIGGLSFLGAFKDLPINERANREAMNFIEKKITSIVQDKDTAKKLIPTHHLGCKRPCSDTNYFESFNRRNVQLIDLVQDPITRFTENGLQTRHNAFDLDIFVYATGFDAMTGAIKRMDIRGKNNIGLSESWDNGPRTYLGLCSNGFPNLFFITGPGSPSVLANVAVGVEHHSAWIERLITKALLNGKKYIEATSEAENNWGNEVNAAAKRTLYSSCNNWYTGANVAGKPRVFMPYIGGFPKYEEICREVEMDGYKGFEIH